MLHLPCRPSLNKNHMNHLKKQMPPVVFVSYLRTSGRQFCIHVNEGWGEFSDKRKQNGKYFFQKKKEGEIWEYIEMNLFGLDINVEMQCRCNRASVTEMFCTKRRPEEVPLTLMKPHHAEAAQQNRQKMPDLQPTHLPYCLITPAQVTTEPKVKAR